MSVDASQLASHARANPLGHPIGASIELFDYPLHPPAHLREIYGTVYRALTRPNDPQVTKNICRLYPREHGKSEAVSHVIPTWAAMRWPDIRILILSESQKQANNKLDECRVSINRHADRFDLGIKEDAAREITLEREKNWDVATITAAGFGTSVTGGHFDMIIFDDLVDYQSQRTETRRETVEAEFQNMLNLGSEGETVYAVIGTRKHPEDLYSRILAGPTWDCKVHKAISDFSVVENGEYDVVTNRGNHYAAEEFRAREQGDEVITSVEPHREVPTLWTERWPLSKLIYDYLTASTEGEGSLVWRRENQNDARAMVGQILTEGMLYWTDSLPKPESEYRFYGGVDIGLVDDPEKAASGDTDYWAVAVLAHDPMDGVSYLTELKRKRGMTLRQGIDWVKTVFEPFDMTRTKVESNNAQRWFVQTAKDEGLRVDPSTSTGEKEARIITMSSRFEAGKVKIHERGNDTKWQSFVSEWVQFPGGDHDDRLDAIEIALRNVSQEDVQRSEYSMADLPLGK